LRSRETPPPQLRQARPRQPTGPVTKFGEIIMYSALVAYLVGLAMLGIVAQ
jgi:hypothetical protein